MALIKLMIVDDDDEYSFNLCNSLTHNFSEILLVSYCSNSYNIEEWIKKIDPDIVLTGEKFYNVITKHYAKTLLILSSGSSSSGVAEIPSIYKYKDVNKIAGDIINSFTKAGNIISPAKEKAARIIPVYSASGSTGKTSIALGIGSICSLYGLKVLYLNLEQFQSTKFFFSCNADYSISEVIYYVRVKDNNLISKLTAMRCQDPSTNMFYYQPANNPLEMTELLPGDLEFLIDNLKESGQYDIIVVDMDSRLDANTLKIFNNSDEIIYLLVNDEICLHKTSIFLGSLNKLSNSSNQFAYLPDKIIYVANKVSNQALPLIKNVISSERILSEIPLIESFNSKKFGIMGGPDTIYSSLKQIAGRYIRQQSQGG
ncbi:CobQ/CobB/MinD/ParA nucleotide binding domain protein [Ruminiclostridium hungatei]|uniref:CobQ/CobB/MinD/ParA nucleotide binding domain protein n=1 Tax=Ruminiclostridium hungatei TaxID=48256 RepID=A0A1V4SQY4_RUMHU|nr:hypothetical protein [Ruminiclostridium hungatei]OPX46272.1 CobQ/CobB/MinD/ParA nucleotide binding domain protein [Ruminiclostridium hungatei]